MANTLKVEVANSDVLTHAVINGIDVSNLVTTISSESTDISWTATQDCFITGRALGSTYNYTIYIDDVVVYVMDHSAEAAGEPIPMIPVRKGQKVTVPKYTATVAKFYGVKR